MKYLYIYNDNNNLIKVESFDDDKQNYILQFENCNNYDIKDNLNDISFPLMYDKYNFYRYTKINNIIIENEISNEIIIESKINKINELKSKFSQALIYCQYNEHKAKTLEMKISRAIRNNETVDPSWDTYVQNWINARDIINDNYETKKAAINALTDFNEIELFDISL